MSSEKLAVTYLSVDSFRTDPKNARLHSDRQIRQIARSIEVFGFNVPVLIDANSQLIAGHGRVLAAKRLGLTHVPTITLEHLTEAQTRAFSIADNRLTKNGDWDDRLLGEQFKILSEAEIDFRLEDTGFETSEIDLFIENLTPASAGQTDLDDVLPEASSMQVSRTGDLWRLGKHRVLCGMLCLISATKP
jgi:ParB-like chromosome segregation protein Spo0J